MVSIGKLLDAKHLLIKKAGLWWRSNTHRNILDSEIKQQQQQKQINFHW